MLPRLMPGFRWTAAEAAGLAELFLALEAGREAEARYEVKAHW